MNENLIIFLFYYYEYIKFFLYFFLLFIFNYLFLQEKINIDMKRSLYNIMLFS